MARCAYCNTRIFLGGNKQGDLRFCNSECEQKGQFAAFASQVPDDLVRQETLKLHGGNCPHCSGSGPVDLHTTYRVWSAIVVTSWSSRPVVSCNSCATKRALGDAAYSLVLGWWGLPWGILATPVQVVRNVVAMVRRPDPDVPTEALQNMVRMHIAQNRLAQATRQA
jgi:hypothetical protein